MLRRTKQVKYPIPSPFARYKGESDDSFHERLRGEFARERDAEWLVNVSVHVELPGGHAPGGIAAANNVPCTK